jgi:dCTP deaminase
MRLQQVSLRRNSLSVKPDSWRRRMALEAEMIKPFAERTAGKGIISYGVSSYGYDMRVSREFRVFHGRGVQEVDPKRLSDSAFTGIEADCCVIPPSGFILGRSVEYFRIPRNILTICTGKSTYARCGVIVNVTPFEPEWEGFATIEISNSSPLPVRIYGDEGIAQLIFLESAVPCETSYRDKKGLYQAQTGITLPRLK